MGKRTLRSTILLAAIGVLTLSSCTITRKAPRADAKATAEHKVYVSYLPKQRKKLVEEARTWLGTPYVYAADKKGEGTDCSGMVMQVYLAALDYALPRNSARQAEFCLRIDAEEAEAGDLVFFATGKDPKKVSHVGLLVDRESFIHASSSKGVVVSKLSNPWYAARLLMYGRVPQLQELSEQE